MTTFEFTTRATRVVFGDGLFHTLAAETQRLGLRRVHLITSPRWAEAASTQLGASVVACTPKVAQHVPIEDVDTASREGDSNQVDGYVAVGGGSAIGLAKALTLRNPAPILAVPTTFSGSEMSPIWGITENGIKVTGRSEDAAPRTVIYDPQLVAGLPRQTAVTSTVNAMAHAVEALYADDGSPLIALIAEESIRLLAGAVTRFGGPDDGTARAEALQGAWLAGICLGSASMALHHKICHTLGGFGLPHAETHSVMLPHVVAYNTGAAPDASAALERALGSPTPAAALQTIIAAAGTPTTLHQLGFGESDIDRAVDLATRAPYPNPAPITADGIRRLLLNALRGTTPGA
ncbi:maleylacetate reductase [Rhodococcus pyridinivorans]|uniref:maleylacetate reductase n=1 Tax=Rhodococcus pyridinivorans TaxID=103816 RepID=UPI001FFEE803|nr:maleylacetate reductase [Rhodococcus pyridinivorans]MCW3472013.1 maleylacetate reductase [Rhodococcus pyridinivorans]UPK61945.1 maleylacetate reductase [Rhodococcus pyridinivorans]